jgi:peptidylprolyl isomerase
MSEAQEGNTVKVHYTGSLEDGTVFDSSEGRDPLEFKVGEQRVIPGFEKAVVGMTPGEKKQEKIPADEAYGPHREDMVLEVERTQLPENIVPEVGLQLQMTTTDGRQVPVKITDVDESKIKLDANHPLAGKDLIFDLELVEVK